MSNDWRSCDGYREALAAATPADSMASVSRRGLLVGLGMGAVGWLAANPTLAQIAVRPGSRNQRVLVVVFLRGGMDGLNVVVPKEDAYYRLRPSLGLKGKSLLPLDDFYSFNAKLAPLLPIYRDGRLALIHAVGSNDHSHSHFEAMSAMEHGLPQAGSGTASGWLARHLESTRADTSNPLRAVALGSTMPDSLRGASQAIAIESVADYRLTADDPEFRKTLGDLYGNGKDPYTEAGHATLEVLDTLNRLNPAAYRPSVRYPKTDVANALQQVAFLIKANIGVEVAALDKGGWDTHVAEAQWLDANLDDLAQSLAAFYTDLGGETARTTVVVQTEFGRRAAENSGLGTDHGRGSVMFMLGGEVRGGKVYGEWPGLEPNQLEDPGDLRVTTDYRRPLAEALRHCGNPNPSAVFPGFVEQPLGLL